MKWNSNCFGVLLSKKNSHRSLSDDVSAPVGALHDGIVEYKQQQKLWHRSLNVRSL